MQSISADLKRNIGEFARPKTPFKLIDKILTVLYHQFSDQPNPGIFDIYARPGIQLTVRKQQNPEDNGVYTLHISLSIFTPGMELELQYNIEKNFNTSRDKLATIKDVVHMVRYILLNYTIHKMDAHGVNYVDVIQADYQHIQHKQVHVKNINSISHNASPKIQNMIQILNIVRPNRNPFYS